MFTAVLECHCCSENYKLCLEKVNLSIYSTIEVCIYNRVMILTLSAKDVWESDWNVQRGINEFIFTGEMNIFQYFIGIPVLVAALIYFATRKLFYQNGALYSEQSQNISIANEPIICLIFDVLNIYNSYRFQ